MYEPSIIHVFRLPIELRSENPFSVIACLKSNRRSGYGIFALFEMPEDKTKITIAEGVEVVQLQAPITLTTTNGELTVDHLVLIMEFPEDKNIFEVTGLVAMVYCGGIIATEQISKYLETFNDVDVINLFELSKKSKIEVVSETFYRLEKDSTKSIVRLRTWNEETQQYENISADIEGHHTLIKEGMAMSVFQLGDVNKDDTEHGIPAQMDMLRRTITRSSLN